MGVGLTAQRAWCKGCLNRKQKEDPELLLDRLVAAAEEVSKQRDAYKRFVETMPVLSFAVLQREAGAAASTAEAPAAATAQATAASAGSLGSTKSGTQQQLQQQQKRQGGKKEAAEGAAAEAAPTQNLSKANPRKEDRQYATWVFGFAASSCILLFCFAFPLYFPVPAVHVRCPWFFRLELFFELFPVASFASRKER